MSVQQSNLESLQPGPNDFLTHQCSVHIDAPAEAVWRIVGDLGNSAEIAGSDQVLSIEKVGDGPVGVGTKYIAQEKIGMRFKAESEILEYEPNRLIVWRARPTMGVPPERGHRWAFRLEPEDGGARLVEEVCACTAPWPARIFQILGTRGDALDQMKRGMERTLQNVKERAEQGTG